MRSVWIGAGIGFGMAMLFTVALTRAHLYDWGNSKRLVHIGIIVRGGHGSPGNDQRSGRIPYVKVSDIRGLRVNINPTNLVTKSVAHRYWRGKKNSGLKAWDLLTPNRASSNIGEFAVLLPGEEGIVITKEVFILRVQKTELIDQFYLLWALSLKAVRDQWRRIALMQTNREDCGSRFREVLLPRPISAEWALKVSAPFRNYFTTVATARETFLKAVVEDSFEYVANVRSAIPLTESEAAAAQEEVAEAQDAPKKKVKKKVKKKELVSQ